MLFKDFSAKIAKKSTVCSTLYKWKVRFCSIRYYCGSLTTMGQQRCSDPQKIQKIRPCKSSGSLRRIRGHSPRDRLSRTGDKHGLTLLDDSRMLTYFPLRFENSQPDVLQTVSMPCWPPRWDTFFLWFTSTQVSTNYTQHNIHLYLYCAGINPWQIVFPHALKAMHPHTYHTTLPSQFNIALTWVGGCLK